VQVDLRSGQESHPAMTKNIGAGGLFVATDRLRRVGERVELTFTLPGSALPLSVESEVRWIRPAPPPDRAGREAGMGVRFVGLPHEARDVIETFLRERETREREDNDLRPPPPPASGRSRT
jgi:uncharacterized protein (TIGR02266 family)